MNTNGRGKGNINKLTKQVKSTLYTAMEDEYKKIGRHLNCVPPEERAKVLLMYLPYLLPKGGTTTAEQTSLQELIHIELLAHFKRLRSYISLSSASKKPELLIKLLKHLTPKQQEIVVKAIGGGNQP